MNPNAITGLLQLISAAVTPVVMISACATLILGINAKHSGTADRVRELTKFFRSETTASDDRQENLREQIRIFYRRFLVTRAALWMLYMAVAAFIACVLYILLSQRRLLSSGGIALSLFVVGVFLMLASVCLEFTEIYLSRHSLFLEVEDILQHSEPFKPLPTSLARLLLRERKPKS